MRCPPALSLLLLGLALPACAQRGGGMHGGGGGMHGGGGSAGHASGGFAAHAFGTSGGPRSGTPFSRYAGYGSRYAGPASRIGSYNRSPASRYAGPRYGYPNASAANRPAFFSRTAGLNSRNGLNRGGRNNGYRYNGYGYNGYGYGFPVFNPFLGAYLDWPSDPFWNGDDGYDPSLEAEAGASYPDAGAPYPDQPAEAYNGGYGPDPEPQPQSQPAPYAPTPYLNAPAYAQPGAAPQQEDAITLIYKDGRPSEQVRNYALTREALYITGRRIREIPLSDLDLPATERVNGAAGIPFQLP